MSAIPQTQSHGVREWATAFAAHDHSVQFYDSDDYLCRLVAEFVADGIRAGEPAVIIATEAHRRGVATELRSLGIDPGTITMLDARETLETFVAGPMPDEARFRSTIGGVLETLQTSRARIRAYGEMVDLLWRDGNPEAAVQLEEYWNGLGGLYSFSLLCAYPMGNFYKESHGRMFEEVCRTHTRVMPSEAFGPIAEDARAREIALLQQRAGALEAEVAHRKELERALRESLEKHRQNEERQAAIAAENARLYRIAADANRAKDEFLATLSHELRTPLTAILGWARMMELGGLDPDVMRTAIGSIDRSARAQAALIDDLLDVSRIVTGKMSMRSDVVDLADVVERAVETLQLAAESRGIAVDVHALRGKVIVTGDANRLQQVAWNLLSNAVKFSDGGDRVSIGIDRDGEHAYLTVQDDGRGIAPNFLPHVFEPFRQADGTSTRTYGGLGLGLAIVKHVTELHGGSVTASSGGGGFGATFLVTLPLAQ
jgi:signal transduction histidine kinase